MSDPQIQNPEVKESLKVSLLDGIFACLMTGFTQDYFAPFLLLIGATAQDIGMLNAVPSLAGALVQFNSADMVEKVRSRRRIICWFVFCQALTLLPMAFLAMSGKGSPAIFIGLVTVFVSLGAFAVPAWSSLMSDLVPAESRGAYFGWRNRLLGSVMVTATFAAGIGLHLMRKVNIFWAFTLIFFCAFGFRLVSCYFLSRMYEPALECDNKDRFTFRDFIGRLKVSNFAQFVVFVALMNFCVYMASPFFSVLMLRDLRFSYLLYSLITVAATITLYATMGRWGRLADKVGNLRVLRFVAPFIGLIPWLWVINRSPLFLVFAQAVSGFLWAGFNLCASNFIYDAVSPAKRARCVAYFNVLNGAAIFCGAGLGGFLLRILPAVDGYKILTLLLISGGLRMMVGLLGPLRLKEVRPVEILTSKELFWSVIGIKPLLGVDRRAVRY